MTPLKHAFVHRSALSETTRRHPYRKVVVDHSSYMKDASGYFESGYIHLVHDIRAGKGWSVRRIAIEDKDFGVIIDHMMQAHPEATVRAIGAALARFGQN